MSKSRLDIRCYESTFFGILIVKTLKKVTLNYYTACIKATNIYMLPKGNLP